MKALCTIYVGICSVYSEKVRSTYFYSKVYSSTHLLAVAFSDRNANIKDVLYTWAAQKFACNN